MVSRLAQLAFVLLALAAVPASSLEFRISFDPEVRAEPIDGRLLLVLSTDEETEPRFQVSWDMTRTMQLFGVDVEGLAPGGHATLDATAFGHPVRRLADIAPGEYFVQAVLHRYDTFARGDGHVVELPASWAAGQRWNREPGNLYSTPKKVRVDPGATDPGGSGQGASEPIEIRLDQVIAPIEPPADTRYVRHIDVRNERLSRFWGRDMFLGAHVLLPEGFDDHPEARYPLMIFHGHYPADFGGFRTEPPDPDLECEYSERFALDCYNRIQQQEAYDFYRRWISDEMPRVLIVEIQHANPFYDDSYAVNSANLGPYGDAITYDLIPEIERRFRGIGEGWARFLYGGSTGGWEALAAQVFYPDEYNGAFAACPDPIDFRAYMQVDIYEDENLYFERGPFTVVERPGHRDALGNVNATLRDFNHQELAKGTKSRSGDQFDVWEAVYSPVGEDGYPRRLYDRLTGEIDPAVAEHWKKYDLGLILREQLADAGPQARRQDPPLLRRHGQLLPQQRGLPRRGVPRIHHRPLLRRRGRLRRPRRALLERRPRELQRDLAAALQHVLPAQDPEEDSRSRRPRGRI